MSRFKIAALALAFPLAAITPSFSADTDAHTTRIEPRLIYGATQSIENGVRVTRPLPPDRHVIINPGSLTPLNLGTHHYNGFPYPPAR